MATQNLTLIALALLTCGAFPAAALSADAPHCYGAIFPEGKGDLQSVYFQDAEFPKLTMTFWGTKGQFVVDKVNCNEDELAFLIRDCGIDCTGPSFRYAKTDSGSLFLSFGGRFPDYVPVMASPLQDFDFSGDMNKGFSVVIPPVEAVDQCQMPDTSSDTVLSPGDISPDVELVERSLGRLGLSTPDSNWVFTPALSEQLSAFQKSRGLPVTGTLDRRTLEAARLEAYAFGQSC